MSDVRKEQCAHGDGTRHESNQRIDYKLLIDPQIRKGEEKLLRYEGENYNTDNHGQGMVILRDPRPRMNRLWSRREKADLAVPRYKVDEWYIGAIPPREITFSKLNDNITKQFMEKMCAKFGKLERVRVYHHPKTQKHMGLSKVVFSSIKSASECVKKLHMTSIMGNVIHAQIDCKGELLNKLFQRIARGEIVAETIPDVIRHTQDGISMSNKYRERLSHPAKKGSRKVSHDDPRKQRRSSDARDRNHVPHSHHSQDSQDLSKKSDESLQTETHQDDQQMDTEDKRGRKFLSMSGDSRNHKQMKAEHDSDSEEFHLGDDCRRSTDLESRISSLLKGQIKAPKMITSPQHSLEEKEESSMQRDIERRERLKSTLSVDSQDTDTIGSMPTEENSQFDVKEQLDSRISNEDVSKPPCTDIARRRRSISPSQLRSDRSLKNGALPPRDLERGVEHLESKPTYSAFNREDSNSRNSPQFYDRRSPPYHYDPRQGREICLPPQHRDRNFHSPRHSPDYGRDRGWKHGFPDRGDYGHDYHRYMYENDKRGHSRHNPDLFYRRRDASPPRRLPSPRERKIRSPPHWQSDRFMNHAPPHHRHSSPPRFKYRRRSSSRERSPRRFRRSLSPDRRKKYTDYHGCNKMTSPEQRLRSDGHSDHAVHREVLKAESPKLTLDQRLKEMTGETIASNSGRNKKRKKDQAREQDNSSVDMEISEGESDGEKSARPDCELTEKPVNRNELPPPGPDTHPERWNFEELPWNGFGPRPNMVPRMWNPMQPNVFEGFERDLHRPPHPFQIGFPRDRWPEQFHSPVGPPGMGSSFAFRPGDPFHPHHHPGHPVTDQDVHERLKDDNLCRCVLDGVVQDLKVIVSRDLNRKVVETMAFKVFESWWDENANKRSGGRSLAPVQQANRNTFNDTNSDAILRKLSSDDKVDVIKPSQSILRTFDPLNWAKNSFEMDGFRIGLGLRSAISKMPSFRVKKQPTTLTPPRGEDDDAGKRKPRKAFGKENQGQVKRLHKDKKYNRITALDSEGEDEDNQSVESDVDSSSEQYHKGKMTVLDVDEVFSESSESSEDSGSESEKGMEDESSEAESDSEDESSSVQAQAQDEELRKKQTPEAAECDTNQSLSEFIPKNAEHESTQRDKMDAAKEKSLTNSDGELPNTGEDPDIAASLLSPTALGVTASAITPQQLRHVHPKKRHRLLSHDQYEPFAKVANISKQRDDLSVITEKERAVLEALADMQRTPDRRISQDSDSSLFSQSDSKSPTQPNKMQTSFTPNDEQPYTSPQQELEAVEALLSIKKSVPPPPISVTPQLPLIPRSDSNQMAELAEEHNYFTPSYGPSRPHPSLDPVVAQIMEEHSYSQILPNQSASDEQGKRGISSPASLSNFSVGSVYNFSDENSEIISAAERVKLRHVQPKKKTPFKKRQPREKHKIKFAPRSKIEDLMIAYEMWCNGLSLEDMKYLRIVYEEYLEKSNSPSWVNDSHWVPHPVTVAAAQPSKHRRSGRSRDGSRSNEIKESHTTGSARTEGLYKLENMIKLKQRREMYGKEESVSSVQPESQSCHGTTEVNSGNQSALEKNIGSRETRHFMRRIASEVGADVGDLFKYNQLMFRKKAVKFKRSSIHGWGLFAEEPIAADEMVIEYVGQVVRTLIAERREVHYTKIGIGSSYLFRIDSDNIIDATKCGNYARFMNHSCNPSCYAKVITVDNAKKIVIYSKGPIKKSEEITYDYKFPLEDDKIMCYCGAENCRRTLN